MAPRAMITGASGFVGGYLIEHLRAGDEAVLACDLNVTMDRPDDADPQARGLDWVRWDLADADGLDRATRERIERFRPAVIYHLAAVSIPADCGAEVPTPEAVAVNVEGTRRVLELAAALPSRPRVLVVSSSHVYAPVTADAPKVSEDWLARPATGYGKTKLAAERVAWAAVEQKGLDVVIIRAFQHTAARQSSRMMLPEWASQFATASDEPVKVRTLDAWIDVSDVRDVVRAYRLLAQRGTPGGIYNVGSGVRRRSGDLLELLRQMADPARPIVELRPGRKQDPIADISRLVECTGWRAEIPIERTIADTWAYWQATCR